MDNVLVDNHAHSVPANPPEPHAQELLQTSRLLPSPELLIAWHTRPICTMLNKQVLLRLERRLDVSRSSRMLRVGRRTRLVPLCLDAHLSLLVPKTVRPAIVASTWWRRDVEHSPTGVLLLAHPFRLLAHGTFVDVVEGVDGGSW